MDFIRIIIAILLPPLGVFLQVGFGGAFWLNILLTLCGYIPGIVHAVYIIAKLFWFFVYLCFFFIVDKFSTVVLPVFSFV